MRSYLKRTEIVCCSGYNDKENMENAKRAGMEEYLTKPVQREELRKILGKVKLIRKDKLGKLGNNPGSSRQKSMRKESD